MTDKKYTNEEIEKALSLCSRTTEVVYCDQCPLCGEYECIREIKVLALDLINRQKAEIERMKGSTIVSNIMESQRIKREVKIEAYKKFSKNAVIRLTDNYHSEYARWIDDTIDDLLKEMTGEIND